MNDRDEGITAAHSPRVQWISGLKDESSAAVLVLSALHIPAVLLFMIIIVMYSAITGSIKPHETWNQDIFAENTPASGL